MEGEPTDETVEALRLVEEMAGLERGCRALIDHTQRRLKRSRSVLEQDDDAEGG